jgi:hypothetical protein
MGPRPTQCAQQACLPMLCSDTQPALLPGCHPHVCSLVRLSDRPSALPLPLSYCRSRSSMSSGCGLFGSSPAPPPAQTPIPTPTPHRSNSMAYHPRRRPPARPRALIEIDPGDVQGAGIKELIYYFNANSKVLISPWLSERQWGRESSIMQRLWRDRMARAWRTHRRVVRFELCVVQ